MFVSDVGEDVADAEVCGRHIQPRDHDHHRSRLHRQDPCGEWKHGQATDLVSDYQTIKRHGNYGQGHGGSGEVCSHWEHVL